MKRSILATCILTAAVAVTAVLAFPDPASTQSLPPASVMRAVETTYSAVGVSTIGNTGSVAWFVETNSDKDRHPIACVAVSGNVECKRGTFPKP